MNQKYIFLWALVVTLVFFNIGIFFGYMLESSRVNKINEFYVQSDADLLDQRIQSDAFDIVNLSCEDAINSNIIFADKIFEDAKTIQRFEGANKFNKDIVFQHKRFDLLRTLFWMNSIKIKDKCDASYHNVVYFYKYNDPSIEQKARQGVFSRVLEELKQDEGRNIMLIPIAGDNNLTSVDLLIKTYKIDKLPTILIDENIKIDSLESKDDLKKYLR